MSKPHGHDQPLARLDHGGRHRARQQQLGVDAAFETLAQPCDGPSPEWRAERGAVGIAFAVIALIATPDRIDDPVQPAEAAQAPGDELVDLPFLGVVAAIGMALAAGGLDLAGGILEGLLALVGARAGLARAAGDDDGRAGFPQRPGNAAAEPARGARDEADLGGERLLGIVVNHCYEPRDRAGSASTDALDEPSP